MMMEERAALRKALTLVLFEFLGHNEDCTEDCWLETGLLVDAVINATEEEVSALTSD